MAGKGEERFEEDSIQLNFFSFVFQKNSSFGECSYFFRIDGDVSEGRSWLSVDV